MRVSSVSSSSVTGTMRGAVQPSARTTSSSVAVAGGAPSRSETANGA
ncbi:MAG: hypothetical protein H6Q01_1138, partial [Acidobacteria bacterium]|nr:hypothetical protein [Acidobacteriota bacterium]